MNNNKKSRAMHNKNWSHMLSAEQFCSIIPQNIIINFILNIAPPLGILSLMLVFYTKCSKDKNCLLSYTDSSTMSALTN